MIHKYLAHALSRLIGPTPVFRRTVGTDGASTEGFDVQPEYSERGVGEQSSYSPVLLHIQSGARLTISEISMV